jgi:cytochrome c-type biogenesis protein CcmH/NrfG
MLTAAVVVAVVMVALLILLLSKQRPFIGRDSSRSALALRSQVEALERRRAQWPEIENEVNPERNESTAELLRRIRGPNQFIPHAGSKRHDSLEAALLSQ